MKSFVVLGLELWWSEEDEEFLCLTSRGSEVKKRIQKLTRRKVKTVDESIVGLSSATFGAAALVVRIGSLRCYISSRPSPDQAFHRINYTWKHYR